MLAAAELEKDAASWCSFALLGKVGTQSGGKDAVERPVGQDARQAGEQCGVAADGVASARPARRHCIGDHLGRGVSGHARIGVRRGLRGDGVHQPAVALA